MRLVQDVLSRAASEVGVRTSERMSQASEGSTPRSAWLVPLHPVGAKGNGTAFTRGCELSPATPIYYKTRETGYGRIFTKQ
jgi:hypothetical protein